jgi:DNA-binding GntR family transcriptional regulator
MFNSPQALVDTDSEFRSPESSPASRWPNSLVGSIAQEIAADIVAGRLRAGHDLNSVDLARRFESSRTPVREALLLLEKEGLIEIESHRRPRVKRWTWSEICELYQVRAVLFGLLSESIVANATDAQIETLDPLYADLVDATEKLDVDAFFRANVAFREAELAICSNTQLRQFIDHLGLRVLHLRRYSVSFPEGMAESCADRGRLLRAYHERDAALAIALGRSVILRGLNRIQRLGWKGTE